MKLSKTILAMLFMSVFMITLTACDSQGPAEEAGEEIDETFEDAGEAIDDATDDD